MTTAAALLRSLMDGEHPHSVCAKAKGGRFYTVGLYTDPDSLLDAAAAATARGEDVWFGVHPLRASPHEGRGGEDDIALVRCLVADLDWYDSDAHADTDLPDETTVRNTVARLEHAPSFIVETGHGLQTYFPLAVDVTPGRGHELTARLHALLAGKGLKPERGDLASVLRVPGSFNFKTAPVEVRLDGCQPDLRYQPEYLDKRFPPLNGRSASSATRGKWRTVDRDTLHPLDLACLQLLERRGGHDPFVQGDTLYVVGPNSKADRSASIGHIGPGIVHMFTSSWKPFVEGRTYSLDELEAITPSATDEAEEAAETLQSWTPVDLGPAWRGEKVSPAAVVFHRDDGLALLPPGINYNHGDSGDGKSLLAAVIALTELRAGHHAVWVSYEDADELLIIGRLRQLGATWEDVERLHFFAVDHELAGGVGPLVELVDSTGARLLVLDSVGEGMAVSGVNEDRDNEVGPWFRTTLRAVHQACSALAIWPIDHSTKAKDNPLFPSGSKRKRAAVTGRAFLLNVRSPFGTGAVGYVQLVVAKDRGGMFKRGDIAAEIMLDATSEPYRWTVTAPRGGDTYTAKAKRRTAVERVLEVLGESAVPLTAEHVARIANGSDRRRDGEADLAIKTVRNALGTLSEVRRSEQQADGRKPLILWHIERPEWDEGGEA